MVGRASKDDSSVVSTRFYQESRLKVSFILRQPIWTRLLLLYMRGTGWFYLFLSRSSLESNLDSCNAWLWKQNRGQARKHDACTNALSLFFPFLCVRACSQHTDGPTGEKKSSFPREQFLLHTLQEYQILFVDSYPPFCF